MKKFKFFLFLIVIGFTALIIYQNRVYFLAKQALSLSLGVETWHWTAPEVENVYYFAGCLVIGLLIAGFIGFSAKLKSLKTIKSLNASIESHLDMIKSLKGEIEVLKSHQNAKTIQENIEKHENQEDQELIPEVVIDKAPEDKKQEKKEENA